MDNDQIAQTLTNIAKNSARAEAAFREATKVAESAYQQVVPIYKGMDVVLQAIQAQRAHVEQVSTALLYALKPLRERAKKDAWWYEQLRKAGPGRDNR